MKQRNTSAWRNVYPLIRPHLGAIILMNVITVLQAAAQVALAVITKYVIDAALAGARNFLSWAIALGGTLLAIVFFHSCLSWLAGRTTDHCVARMRQALLAAAERSGGEMLQNFHSGQLLSRGMSDVHTVCDGFVTTLPATVGQLARLMGAFSAIVVMYPSIALPLLIASILIVASTAVLRPVMRRQHQFVRNADDQVISQMQENLQQLELVQSLQMEQQSQNRFSKWLQGSLLARRNCRIWSVGISTFLSLASQLGTGALLLWCAVRVAGGYMTYGALTAMLQLLSMLRSPVVGLSGIWTRISAIEVSAQRLCQLLDQPEDTTAPASISRVEAVVFEDVTFRYPGDETPVLEHFTLTLPLTHWTCLTGISGKGKSTMFKLILGLYTPQHGRVYLQTDQGPVTCSSATRHLFAYVPQDYSLFSGSILENLQLVAPDADEPQCNQALTCAQADFVFELTAGLQTQLRENNTGLSKGQIQRLAIARAILMNRPVFLLDECTSALDAQTESNLLSALSKLNKKAILVTHRPEAVSAYPDTTFIPMDR